MFDLVPFRRNDMARKGDTFDNIFDNFFNDNFFYPANFNAGGFRVDLKEDDKNYLIEADLPGIDKDNIQIDYENNYLTISAKREDVKEDNSDNYVRKERHYGEFRRSFYIDNVDENKIDASFKNGVLALNLPKKEITDSQRRRIEIH